MAIEKKAVLQRFVQYVFRPEAETLRESLLERVAEMAVYLSGNRGADVSLIRNIARKQMEINLERSVLRNALRRLVEKSLVIEKGDKYFLVKERVKRIDKTIEQRMRVLKNIEEEFMNDLKKKFRKITPEQKKTGIQFLYEVLALVFTNESRFVSSTLRLSAEDIEFIMSYKPPAELLEDLLSKIKDKQFAKCIGAAIASLFSNPKFSQFLHITAQNFLFFEVLNLDPECRFIEKEVFSNKTLLLDTNFLMALLLPSDHRHPITVQTAFFSRKIGTNIAITKRTEEEFRDELRHANTLFRRLKCNRLDILRSVDDGFIASYALEKQKKPSLSWSDFHSKLKAFRTILNKFGITLLDERDLSYEVLHSKLFPETTGYVLTCGREVTRKVKSKNVAEHDAYHVLLVRKLRANQVQDMFGPKVWFLTFDSSLLCVDKGVNKLIGSKYEAPSSMMSWAWLELITPYFGADVQENILSRAFAGLMRSSFAAMPVTLSIADLLEIQSPKMNFDNFSVEEIEELLGDELVQRYLRMVKEARLTRSTKLKKYKKELKKQAKKKSEFILERKISEEIFWRRVSGIISVVSVLFGILSVLLNNLFGASLLFIAGGFFMAVAVGYKKIEMGMKKLGIRK